MDEQICELCRKTSMKSLFILENDLRGLLVDILTKSIPNVSQQQNMVCNECRDNLQIFNNFKMAYVNILDTMLRVGGCTNDASLDFKENEHVKLECDVKNPIICRFCTKIIINLYFVPLNELKKNTYILNMLEKHIPGLDLNNTEYIFSCESCHGSLQALLSFLMNCFNVEEKKTEYMEIGGDEKNQLGLKNVQQFMFQSTFKQESGFCDAIENELHLDEDQKQFVIKSEPKLEMENKNNVIKTEEIDIKSEEDISGGCKEDKKQHISTHKDPSEIKMHKCDICAYETKYSRNKWRHMLIHIDPSERRKFKCRDCSYEATSSSSMWRHKMTHKDPSEIIIHKCELCTFETKHKASLRQHLLTHKDLSQRVKYKCTDCDHESLYKRRLRLHMLSHGDLSNRKKYVCKDCSYETNDKTNFTRHSLTHKNPLERKSHKCEDCAYTTIYKQSLVRHILTHQRIPERNKYKCKDCAYETYARVSMRLHKATHKDSSVISVDTT